jgi:type II secretory pathway component GspD/PulD (secretin)
MTEPGRWMLLLATLVIALLAPAAAGQADEPPTATAMLEDVRVAAEGDSIVVRIKTSSPRRYQANLIDTPYRLVVDLEDTTYAWRKIPFVTTAGPLIQIRGGQYKKGIARVVLDLTSRVPYSIRDEGGSLVVVLGAPTANATHPAAAPVPVAVAATQQPPSAERGPEESPQPPVRVAQDPPAAPPVAPPAGAVPPTTPTPVPGDSRMISLEFKDADVVNLLRILAAESGRNIVMGDDVKGKMSISLRNVPWTLALETILETRGLQRVDKDGVIRIVSTEQLTKEREARVRMDEAKVKAEVEIRTKIAEVALKEQEARLKEQQALQRRRAFEAAIEEARARGPLTEVAIRLAYADPGEVANTLQGLLGLGTAAIRPCREEVTGFTSKEGATARTVRIGTGSGVSGPIAEPPFSQLFGPPSPAPEEAPQPPPPTEDVSARTRAVRAHCSTNTLFLRLHAADLERVRTLVRESLDIPVPQIKIEARMEILDRNDLFAIGIQWGGGGLLAVDNKNAIVGRGFTSDPANVPTGGIPPAGPGVGNLSNPNLPLGQVIPVSGQTGLPLGGNLINLPIGGLLQGGVPAGVGGLTFGIIGSRLNINLALEALRTQGKTFTLARPDILTLENKQARIALGEEIPFPTVSSAGTKIEFKEALLQLIVTPTVVREPQRTRIKMTVLVENNSRGGVVNLGTLGAPPAINKRSAETEVLINEGDHLVIGGITTSIQEEEVRKVPLFGDIPILGWLFKQRGTRDTRRELVVFITTSVLKDDARPRTSPPIPAPPAPTQPPAK